jgi:hypothetical protein
MVQMCCLYHSKKCRINVIRAFVRLFLEHGADFKTGSPFAQALMCKARTVLGIFNGLLEKDPSIIAQANEALVYRIKKDNLKDRAFRWAWWGQFPTSIQKIWPLGPGGILYGHTLLIIEVLNNSHQFPDRVSDAALPTRTLKSTFRSARLNAHAPAGYAS